MKTTIETTVQHTAGPWHIGMKPGPMVYGPNGEQTADLRCGSMLSPDEAKANLRLIAAAPDLLAALEANADIFTNLIAYATQSLGARFVAQIRAAAEATDAAIAKAKGL